MKLLHQVGFRSNWNMDAYFKNDIGDGFIFCAYSIEPEKIITGISSYSPKEYLPISMIDLQYFGNKESRDLGKFETYSFHPANSRRSEKTEIEGLSKIMRGISFQEKQGFDNIIIPNFYYDYRNLKKLVSHIKAINKTLQKRRGKKYYLSVPLSYGVVIDDEIVENLLFELTDMKMNFDGYYIVCESNPGFRKKINDDFDYYNNLTKIFDVLKSQDFKIIYGYANFDALVFASQVDLDYVSIGTFENLRHFTISRYTHELQGGPSEGWYFSEKLLNFIKAKDLKLVRKSGALKLIKNEKNIFSDIIINSNYIWNSNKVDIHKNYLLSLSRLLNEMGKMNDKTQKTKYLLRKIVKARKIYEDLAQQDIYLLDESSDYHLSTWYSFLKKRL